MPPQPPDELCWTPATELASLISEGEVSPTEVAEACIDRIERVNPRLNAIVEHDPERVRAQARELTERSPPATSWGRCTASRSR